MNQIDSRRLSLAELRRLRLYPTEGDDDALSIASDS